MSRHSRNNTNASCFTYAERQMLNYGTKEQRVGQDSIKSFDACYLCLHRLREPLSCDFGHLACKECLYENILSQKTEIARHKKLVAKQEAKLQKEQSLTEKSKEEETEKEFIRLQMSLVASGPLSMPDKRDTVPSTEQLELDGPLSSSVTTTTTATAMKTSVSSLSLTPTVKSVASAAPSAPEPAKGLTSFWIPSLTPSVEPSLVPRELKVDLVCSLGQHPISLKKLIPVHFTLSKDDSIICPCCHKACTNASRLALIKTCGHVLCQPCLKTSLASDASSGTDSTCPVCSKPLRSKDVLPLAKDGTGFTAGGGSVLVRKYDTAFQ